MDRMQEEAAGGSGGAGGGAVAGGEDFGNVGETCAAGDVDEGADEVADHVMEEAGAGDAVDEQGGLG